MLNSTFKGGGGGELFGASAHVGAAVLLQHLHRCRQTGGSRVLDV